MLLHATTLVDDAMKDSVVANEPNIDNDGDRPVGGTKFCVLISEQESYRW